MIRKIKRKDKWIITEKKVNQEILDTLWSWRCCEKFVTKLK